MRLHSLIFATCCNIPSIALEYEPKVSSFMKYIELDTLIAGNVSTISFDNLLQTFNYINNNNDSISKTLAKQTKILRNKAIENASLAIALKNEKRNKNEN